MNRQIRVGYLVTGLVFLGLSVTWLLRETDVIHGTQWFFPAVLLGAGVIGLAASLGASLSRGSDDTAAYADDAYVYSSYTESPASEPATEPAVEPAPETVSDQEVETEADPEIEADAEAEPQTAIGTDETGSDSRQV